jgi:hypothetical protein
LDVTKGRDEGDAPEPKVSNFYCGDVRIGLRKQDVLWLDVTMDDLELVMQVGQTRSNL